MMTRRTVARTAMLATGAVAVFVLAACGGGSNNASGGSQTTAAGVTGSSTGTAFAPVTTPPATGTSTVPVGGGGGETGGGTVECRTASLKLSLGPTNGAAGHVYQALLFTNVSKQSCLMVGFPGVSYVTGGNGTQVGAPAQKDGTVGQRITLQPGQVASSIITMTDVGVFDPATCKPTPTRGLRVYPPDNTASLFIAQNGTGCAGNPPSPQLRVQTIKPGAGNA